MNIYKQIQINQKIRIFNLDMVKLLVRLKWNTKPLTTQAYIDEKRATLDNAQCDKAMLEHFLEYDSPVVRITRDDPYIFYNM